jgi:ferritin-like metal-binding protein YciE
MKSNKPKSGEGVISKIKKEVSKVLTNEEEEQGLKQVFINELKDIYYAEKCLVKKLPEMAKASTTAELTTVISNHQLETQIQVQRLEEIFYSLGKEAKEKKCEAISGLITEGEKAIKETPDGSMLRDVVIIACAQKIEHYEIATYGTLRTIAAVLNLLTAETLLGFTLDEEKNADNILTAIAAGFINREAKAESDEMEQQRERKA